MLKAVIFDIDGTLYDYHAAHAIAFRGLTAFAEGALSVSPQRFERLHSEADRLLRQRCGGDCAAVHNRLIRYQLMLELLGRPIGLAPAMAGIYWKGLLGAMKPFDGLADTFHALRRRGLGIGIGTNMTADYQFSKLEALGVLRMVDFMVTSEEAGAEKPDRRLFDMCAEKAGCAPAECLFVGDSLRGDVLGALSAGMEAAWLCPGGSDDEIPPRVTRIGSLPELIKLVDE